MIPQYDVAIAAFVGAGSACRVCVRLRCQQTKRRYRRTVTAPLWPTPSLRIFTADLAGVWARLWNQAPRTYLPFLCAGMLSWNLVQAMIIDGCSVFVGGEKRLCRGGRRGISHHPARPVCGRSVPRAGVAVEPGAWRMREASDAPAGPLRAGLPQPRCEQRVVPHGRAGRGELAG